MSWLAAMIAMFLLLGLWPGPDRRRHVLAVVGITLVLAAWYWQLGK